MAYKMTIDGMDDLSRMLSKLGDAALGVASASLYEGAGVMADKVSQAVHGIATEPFRYVSNGNKRKPSPEEKAILVAAPKGVAKFKTTADKVNTSVGLANAGYAKLGKATKPIPQIANAINSGTSFMQKQPFFRKAVSQGTPPATEKIKSGILERVEEMTK